MTTPTEHPVLRPAMPEPQGSPPTSSDADRPAAPARNCRTIALYLPQFHPIPENDEWWGKGFTEWTNTAKAKPMFRGHYQPHVPADLGFYDLRVPESRQAQADLAAQYGVEAFCYYHYWFGGRRILERPFNEVLASGEPGFPFCLCWANETWSGRWHGLDKKILIEQTYPGEDDHRRHFDTVLPAFLDRRYVRVDGKPLFLIYRPRHIPELPKMLDLWTRLATDAGLPGIWFVAHEDPRVRADLANSGLAGFTFATVPSIDDWISRARPIAWAAWKWRKWRGLPAVFDHRSVADSMLKEVSVEGLEYYPTVIPNWDNTPRSGKRGLVLTNSSPELFAQQLDRAIAMVADRPMDRKLIFVKSWNEWAEGNHLEPDQLFGLQYLERLDSQTRDRPNHIECAKNQHPR